MKKILLSWIALENDFKGTQVNSDGPTVNLHKYFYEEYEYHLLLTSSKTLEEIRFQHLVTYLRNNFKSHKIVEKALGINDVIDISEITAKITVLLLSLSGYEIDIFISPGTPTMQVAWYFAHESLGLKTRLFQLRKAQQNKNKVPERNYVNFQRSNFTSAVIINQSAIDNDFKKTDKIIIGRLKEVYNKVDKILPYDNVRILIIGETGTGKELLANYIHENSPRKNYKFIALNCSSLGDTLLESRLFGHIKGAFTGASETKTGILQELDGGTLFLDEIGDISSFMQQSLLRFLQSGEFLKVGSNKIEKSDVRIIAATNKNLIELIKLKTFRDDLYFRLAGVIFKTPSLNDYTIKQRLQIFDFLFAKSRKRFNKVTPNLNISTKTKIVEYPYWGNFREMQNIIDQLIIFYENDVNIESLLPELSISFSKTISKKLIDVQLDHIYLIYNECDHNISKAARILGLSKNTLISKLKQLNLK